jgi:hypothetical protein
LGFVALNPTYILPVLLRNSKPNNGRFRNRAAKVSFSIKLAALLRRVNFSGQRRRLYETLSFFYDQTDRFLGRRLG